MTDALTPENLPWAPIYTVTRSGLPELTIYGVVYVWVEDRKLFANAGHSLLRIGNTRTPIWTRSLLKPWQLMVLYPTLKQAYPALTGEHFAMMLASHMGDARQVKLLGEILAISGLFEDSLQCPSCGPMASPTEMVERVINHPCSGKHLAHLLYLKAKNLPTETYLHPEAEPYQLLKALLGYLLNREDFEATTDGCGMPNFALSAVEIAQLCQALAMPASKDILRQAPDELTDILSHWDDIAVLFLNYPELVGGEHRLDTRLMQGQWHSGVDFKAIAKEGADGLLCVGIGPNPVFADGLGIYIKLSSGYEPKYLDAIVFELLAQLGLYTPKTGDKNASGHLQTHFHFRLEPAAART
jgi:L-asparaginase II